MIFENIYEFLGIIKVNVPEWLLMLQKLVRSSEEFLDIVKIAKLEPTKKKSPFAKEINTIYNCLTSLQRLQKMGNEENRLLAWIVRVVKKHRPKTSESVIMEAYTNAKNIIRNEKPLRSEDQV